MKKILIIRRDNIGDLICTTPMISMIRQAYPDAQIDLLVNSYNAPVLQHNPDINHLYIYTKGKHREAGQSLWQIYFGKLALLWRLWRNQYDLAVLPSGGYNKRAIGYAKTVRAKKILGYQNTENPDKRLNLPVQPLHVEAKHEVELCVDLLASLGITDQIPPLKLVVTEPEKVAYLDQYGIEDKPYIGVHISARKPSNRWTKAAYIALIQALWNQYHQPIALFWSPGPENHPQHPGDDGLAAAIQQACRDVQLVPMKTASLRQLIVAMSLCDKVFCSDGGAMHVAAGVGKPIVCLFGDSDASRWHPWGVPHVVLQPESRQAADVSVNQVLDAFRSLEPATASVSV